MTTFLMERLAEAHTETRGKGCFAAFGFQRKLRLTVVRPRRGRDVMHRITWIAAVVATCAASAGVSQAFAAFIVDGDFGSCMDGARGARGI
jgi:hypothetical protein